MVTDPEISQRMYRTAASKDKEIVIVDGAWHAELFSGFDNAEAQRKAYSHVADWMEARTK